MKIGLLTFHCALNYGAVLQAVALYNTLKEINDDTILINYRYAPICSIVDRTRRNELKKAKNLLRFVIKGKTIFKKKKSFDQFLLNNISCITEEFNSFTELQNLCKTTHFDLCVTGSDQVWNPYISHFDTSYFLKFVSQNTRKISYAASIGQDSLDDEGMDFIKRNLIDFDSISVREKTAAQIIRKSGIDAPVCVNLDPVFFYPKSWWEEKSIPVKLSSKYKKFIFVYRLTNNPAMDKVLYKITNETGLKCIAITDRIGKVPFIDKKFSSVGPGEFLFLLNNAEMVVTDSFHGIAFSLLFEKKFIAVSNLKRNTRILNLLGKVEMLDCLADQNKGEVIIPNINYASRYTNIKKILSFEVSMNREYLNKEISKCAEINSYDFLNK